MPYRRLTTSKPFLCVPRSGLRRVVACQRRPSPLFGRLNSSPAFSMWSDMALPGSCAASCAFATFLDPAGAASPDRLRLRCSVLDQNNVEDRPGLNLSGLNHVALTLAAYASRFDCSTRARLASGCAASLFPDGFRVLPPSPARPLSEDFRSVSLASLSHRLFAWRDILYSKGRPLEFTRRSPQLGHGTGQYPHGTVADQQAKPRHGCPSGKLLHA